MYVCTRVCAGVRVCVCVCGKGWWGVMSTSVTPGSKLDLLYSFA